MKKISPKQLKKRLDHGKVNILDVRSEEKFQIGHLRHPNAENINVYKEDIFALEKLEEHDELPISNDEEIIITCTSGNSATRCTRILTEKGYNVTLLEGGMVAWNQES